MLVTHFISGQTIATTEYGRTVVLFEDGTYRIGDKAKTKEGDTVILFSDGTFFRCNKSNKDKQHNAEPTMIPIELRGETEISSFIPPSQDKVKPMIGIEGDVQPPEIKETFARQPMIADIKAGFPGGESAFRDYVATEFQYPVRCADERINGSVVLKFIVDEGGRISRVSAIEQTKSCPEFTQEAIRVLRRSPRWIPAQRKGRFVVSWREVVISLPYDK